MHFIYSCTLLSGTQGPHLGGWDSLLCLHSLCQARWLLSLSEEVERWKGKGEGGELWVALNSARVARPQSHHIWRPPAAGLPRFLRPFPLSHTLTFSLCFSRWGRWRWRVWSGCDLCPYFSNLSVPLLWAEREGGSEWRRGWEGEEAAVVWKRSKISFYFMTAPASESCGFCIRNISFFIPPQVKKAEWECSLFFPSLLLQLIQRPQGGCSCLENKACLPSLAPPK